MKASARSGSPARSSTASRITCISLRRMGTVIGSLKASAGHARQRSSPPSRTRHHKAPPPRKNRAKQKGPRYRGPFCLHPCCTFAPANRCNNSPALTTGKAIKGERVEDGSVVARKRRNGRGARGPCCEGCL